MNNYPEYAQTKNRKYKINTDFRYALKCDEIALDETINPYERSLAIIYTLFGDEGIDHEEDYFELLEIAKKYLLCGEEPKKDGKPDMDYIQDMPLIETSFQSDYGIDLCKEKMHWYKFSRLMNGLSNSELGNCCVLNRIRNLRTMDLSQIQDEKYKNKVREQQYYFRLKRYEKKPNESQQKSSDEFNKAMGL